MDSRRKHAFDLQEVYASGSRPTRLGGTVAIFDERFIRPLHLERGRRLQAYELDGGTRTSVAVSAAVSLIERHPQRLEIDRLDVDTKRMLLSLVAQLHLASEANGFDAEFPFELGGGRLLHLYEHRYRLRGGGCVEILEERTYVL